MHSPTITRRRPIDPAPPSVAPEADRERFAALYARHRDELARYCRTILRHDEDVEDALQSTMAKAFAALQTETRDIALRPWLFRIAHNEAISIVRRRIDVTEPDVRDGGDPDVVQHAVETRERLRLLREDLDDLPQRQRSALVLHELSGLAHREIADVLGTSPAAVKQAIYDARCGLGDCAAGRSLTCDGVRRALSDGDGRTAGRRRLRAHLRSCRSCRAFAAALRRRPQDLGALFPAWPAAGGAAAGLTGLLSGAGGAAVGTGAAAGSGAATGVVATGSGGGLLGGLAVAGAGKLAGIAAVAVVAGGGVVALERGASAPTESASGRDTAVVRQSASAGPTLVPAANGAALLMPSDPSLTGSDRRTRGSDDRDARQADRDAAPTSGESGGPPERRTRGRGSSAPGRTSPGASATPDRPGHGADRGGGSGHGRERSDRSGSSSAATAPRRSAAATTTGRRRPATTAGASGGSKRPTSAPASPSRTAPAAASGGSASSGASAARNDATPARRDAPAQAASAAPPAAGSSGAAASPSKPAQAGGPPAG